MSTEQQKEIGDMVSRHSSSWKVGIRGYSSEENIFFFEALPRASRTIVLTCSENGVKKIEVNNKAGRTLKVIEDVKMDVLEPMLDMILKVEGLRK